MSRGHVAVNMGKSRLPNGCLTSADSRYIISVVQITSVGEGKIMPSDGSAKFKCAYTAVVMKPFKGEVVDGKVTIVNKVS